MCKHLKLSGRTLKVYRENGEMSCLYSVVLIASYTWEQMLILKERICWFRKKTGAGEEYYVPSKEFNEAATRFSGGKPRALSIQSKFPRFPVRNPMEREKFRKEFPKIWDYLLSLPFFPEFSELPNFLCSIRDECRI